MWMTVGILVAVGGFCLWMAYLIHSKHRIDLIHGYHHRKVQPEDKAAYCVLMGKAMYIIGGAIVVSGIATLFLSETVLMVILIGGFLVALVFIHLAQIRYNGGWFSK